jgi:hypothetical protein
MPRPAAAPLPAGAAAGTAGGAVPATGLPAGTLVLTLEGALPVEHLTPGDRIVTRAGAVRLRGIAVTLLRDAAMVALAPGALGQNRPGRPLLLPAAQPVLLRDWRAPALFGAAQALVPVARLVDGRFLRAVTLAQVRLFAPDLGLAAVIYADGVAVAVAPAAAVAA